MNIFAGLQKYADQYKVTNTRPFSAEEQAEVSSAKVVTSQYGFSVCFYMVSGGQKYIPVSRDSIVTEGDPVNVTTAKLLTLERDGDTIYRVEC